MKTTIVSTKTFYAMTAAALSTSSQQPHPLRAEKISNTIAVPATDPQFSVNGAGDPLFVLQPCDQGGKREPVALSDLPATVSAYLGANYSEYNFHKAFTVINPSGTVTGYTVVVYFNNKPVGLLFTGQGVFVKVLEQREKGDLSGPGYHKGGCFEHRDGKARDSISLSVLPADITGYLSSNHRNDTLVKAFRSRDSSTLIISKNTGVYANLFSASNAFIERKQLAERKGNCMEVGGSMVPSLAADHLLQTYPNYVFKKAIAITENGAVQGFVVVLDANNTQYAVEFDTAGNFISANTIR